MRIKLALYIILLFSLNTFAQTELRKGKKLSNFTIETIDGQSIEIEDLRGKVVHLNFFATWCGPCMKELSTIEKDYLDQIPKEDFYFVAIGRGHLPKELQSFMTKKGYKFPVAYDTDKSNFLRFSKQGIPLNVIINKRGRIIFKETGFSKTSFETMTKKVKRAL